MVGLGIIVIDNNIEMDWAKLAPVCQGHYPKLVVPIHGDRLSR